MPSPDTIDTMERAGLSRWDEGRVLQDSNRSFWAIYTDGYVAECCLKVAFLRLAGLRVGEDATEYIKSIAVKWGIELGVLASKKHDLHDLVFWLDLVFAEREFANKPLDAAFTREFATRVQAIAQHWVPAMRYHPAKDLSREVLVVAAAVKWVALHSRLLWS